MDDYDYLRLLTEQAEQANELLSNACKWQRECWVCQRLFNALNLTWQTDEFRSSEHEPPDVLFRDARFEVFFVLDQGRRLNDEWRAELARRRQALSLSQLAQRLPAPKRIGARELQQRLSPTLNKKAQNYLERGLDLSQLDVLAYMSLKHVSLDFNSYFPPPSEFLNQGWRSLSVVGPHFARVLFAQAHAPQFLRQNLGRTVLLDIGIGL